MNNLTTLQHQSTFDIAIQEYGSVEGVFDLLRNNPGLQFDSEIAPGTVLGITGEIVKPEVVDYYTKNNIKPATGDIDGLIAFTKEDDGMITIDYKYDIADGDKTFGWIRLHNLREDLAIQIDYTNIDTEDVKVYIDQSLDGVAGSAIPEHYYTLLKDKPSHTFQTFGLVTEYIRLRVVTGTATQGAIDRIKIQLY